MSSPDEEKGQSTCWSDYERDAEAFFKEQQVQSQPRLMTPKEVETELAIGKWNDLDDFYGQETQHEGY